MRLSATCGSRRERSGLENGTSSLLPVLVITAAYSRFVLGQDDSDQDDRRTCCWALGSCSSCSVGSHVD